MASILFYTSIRTRVKDQESLMAEFVKAGHKVYFLNQQPNPYLPSLCAQAGVHYETFEYTGPKSSSLRILYHVCKLVWFSFRHRVDIIYSHLEPANFIAVLAQYVLRARVVIVRHHLDLAARAGFDKDRSYRMTYSLARDVIAVSDRAKRYMTVKEGVDTSKIHHIDLGYNFDVFGHPNQETVDKIRSTHELVLISVGRFDEFKRPDLSIDVCRQLQSNGVNCHLFLLGAGPNEASLRTKVQQEGLTNVVSFVGYVDNVLDYLSAADWLLHPSISESSCVVVKEAGLVDLPIIVCEGVGDFDDYLANRKTAVIVHADSFVADAMKAILHFRAVPEDRLQLGRELGKVVRARFDIKNLLHQYDRFRARS